jgi:hypothetical protein
MLLHHRLGVRFRHLPNLGSRLGMMVLDVIYGLFSSFPLLYGIGYRVGTGVNGHE